MPTLKRKYRTVGLVAGCGAVVVAAATFAVVNPSLAANTSPSTLFPSAITTTTGHAGSGERVANLAKLDESGTASNWNKYVEFSGHYAGYLSYSVPATVAASSVSAIQARINYRGPATETQRWTFSLYDWTTSAWVALGTNATAPDWGRWKLLTFNASGNVADYISPSDAIRLQLTADNGADAADIDYAAIVLAGTTTTPPTVSPSGTPTPVPTSSISVPPSASPTVSPSATGTNPPSASTSPTASPTTSAPGGTGGVVTCAACWHPGLRVSWNWVLSKVPAAPYRSVQMYDVDGFDATAADVTAMHDAGIKVVCYISVGTYENWRSDAAAFPSSLLGSNVSGWAGEKWLDVRDVQHAGSTLAKIMNARLDMCRSKGFDAVEFDNVDGYTNSTGFPLTADDQLVYDEFLANAAHSRGMSAVLKNDVDQAKKLLPYFDMALDEQCNQYSECDTLAPFVQAGKPVFNAEYASSTSFCAADNAANLNGVNFSIDLDDSKFQPCR